MSYAQLLRTNPGLRDDERVTIRFPFEVGALVRGAFADVIAYGRSLGVDVQVFRGGGMLVRRYQVVASGEWGKVRRFLDACHRLTVETAPASEW